MLNVTRLLAVEDGPAVSTGPAGPAAPQVVVWNVTRACQLACRHCYAAARARPDPDELTTGEGLALVADLAQAGVRALVLSGGEPLLRPDLLVLAAAAAGRGLMVGLSTNGTLLHPPLGRALAQAGVAYVGVSLDGIGPRHDRVRGRPGAWAAALGGLRAARAAGLRVGIRFTLCRPTLDQLPAVLDLMEAEDVDRGYISHLVQVGRARRWHPAALEPAEVRAAVELVFDRAEAWRRRARHTELVTGNNDADGVALYLRLAAREPRRAAHLLRVLQARGGNAAGRAIAGVDARGDVHPEPFWTTARLGNVRERPFSALWLDGRQPLLAALRDRARRLTGRCRACRYLALCGGGSRARAEALTGDPWAADPGCYLTDTELGLDHGRVSDAPLVATLRRRGDPVVPGECALPDPRHV